MKAKTEISNAIEKAIENFEGNLELEKPSKDNFGDFSTSICLELANKRGENPRKFAEKVKENLKLPDIVEKVEVAGPGFINFFRDREKLGNIVLGDTLDKKEDFGKSDVGEGKTVVIDYSAPNIAKPMSIGHLRSTIIGDSVYKILEFLGYNCIGDNHLGDWGTQFGKLLYAWKQWGSEEKLDEDPIQHLLDLYVKFHDEAEENPKLEERGREWFKKLEDGDEEAMKLWQQFIDYSMREFHRTYDRIGVSFDYELGESFYNDMLDDVIDEALEKGIAERDEEGAVVVKFEDLPTFLIQKSDGATLYQTRDLATVKYRKKEFDFDKALYAVGTDQNLHFRQLFKTCDKMGYADKEELEHVNFGMMRLPEGAMSTRKGRVVFLKDVLDKAQKLALEIIKEKNPELDDKKKIADKVGIGAVKYADLSKNRIKDIEFSWDKAISFEGDSGPYLQYSCARAHGILEKADFEPEVRKVEFDEEEFQLINKLSEFPEKVKGSAYNYEPHRLANYLNEVCESFNTFYHKCPVLAADSQEKKETRLALVKSFSIVISTGLKLLGIEPLEAM